MQNYTLETLINILRKRLQDEEFDGETLTIFINDAQNEILGDGKYPFMQRIDTYEADFEGAIDLLPCYAGTFFIYANKEDQPRQELKYISPEEFFTNTEAHTFVYTTFANQLHYRIAHEDDNTGYTITHLYMAKPMRLVKNTDKTIIPNEYVEALVLGALARAEELRDNFDFAQIYRNQQDQLLTNMKLRYGPGNLSFKNRAKLPYFGGNIDGRI